MIITKTPYRLSLFGGGTDYPSWFENNPSKVIAAAMDHHCYLTVKKLPPFFDYKNRVIYSKIESVDSIEQIDHPSVRSCLKYMGIENVSITHDGDLPAKSGIGSSSSFTVGLLNALYALKGKKVSRETLARDAIHVEQKIIGENVGIQDQIMAAYGGIQLINMHTNWEAKPLTMTEYYKTYIENHIMLGFSGVSRYAEHITSKKVEKIQRGDSYYYLTDMNQITDEALKLFNSQSELDNIGRLLQEAWKIKKQLATGITESWIDDVYSEAMKNGAFGGKLMGAGGGGFFYFLVPPEKQIEFKERMQSIKVWVPFKFATQGSQIIFRS